MPNIIETTDAAGGVSTAYTLNVGDIVQGQITAGGDPHDWYRVNLVAGQTYSFAEVGTGTNNLADAFLRLYASNGTTLVASNDDNLPNGNSLFTFTPTTSGTYYLDAGSYNSAYSGQYGLTVAAGTRPSFDIQMGAGVVDTNYAWNATPGTAANVSFGFRQTLATYVVADHNIATFSQVTAVQMTAIQTALQFCADVCNITFTGVNPGGYTNSATMLFADYTDFVDNSGAFTFGPGSTAASSAAGDVWLNTQSVSRTSLPYSSYSFFAIVHEIGHALGLSHPGLYNATPGVSITYANNAEFVQDSNQWTVMSYFDEGSTGAEYSGYAATPLLFDIYAFQQIYGANTSTRTGDTVYGFGSNAGAVYTATAGSAPLAYSIWDAAGTDTINMSGYSQAQTINLNAGTFSSTGGMVANISIALGAVIENATGGAGADNLIGNGVANVLTGNAGNDRLEGWGGNDTLFGGADTDTAIYHAARASYSVSQNADGSLRISGGNDGTDTVYQVELFQFTDRANPYSLAELFPVIASSSFFGHAGDFNGDGTSDALLRHDNGQVRIWDVSNGHVVGDRNISLVDNSWHLIGSGDFNGNGTDDVLWRNDNGTVTTWIMSGGAIESARNLAAPEASWHIVGVADFNGDHTDDILWRNDNGTVTTWTIVNNSIAGARNLAAPEASWHIVGLGDFNGDNTDDVLWRNDNGTVTAWTIVNNTITGARNLAVPEASWHVLGTGDFNGDASDDVLWFNDNGTLAVWDMVDGQIGGAQNLPTVGSNWHFEAAGDFNHDGTTDILWREDDGTVGLWEMDHGHIGATLALPDLSSAWDIIA